MKKCINCGCELAEEAIFCGECGTKQESPKQFCANCGAQLPVGSRFCGECGTPVGVMSVQNSEPQPAETPQSVTPAPQPKPEVEIISPDGDTLSITYRDITFSMKLVSAPDSDFYIGVTPVTQALWLTLMDNNPSEDDDDLNYPVTNITPSQATSFLVRLQKIFGVKFELPTPEQWGLARSGGHRSEGYRYAGSNDINEVAWTDGELHPVGELFANELGLLDMDGNVEELLKGGEVSLLSPDESDIKNDADFTGFRFVVNLTDNMSGDKPMQQMIAANAEYINAQHEEAMHLYARILKEAETARKTAEKAAAEKRKAEEAARKAVEANRKNEETKRQAQEDARKRKALEDKLKGIVRYKEGDELEEGFLMIFKDECLEHKDAVDSLLDDAHRIARSSNTIWKPYFDKYMEELSRANGIYEDYIEYAIEDDILVVKIDGDRGDMPDLLTEQQREEKINAFYDDDNVNFYTGGDYNSWIISRDIPVDKITKLAIIGNPKRLGKRCFYKFKNVETLIMPDSVETISFCAFLQARSLKNIRFSKNLKIIEDGSFQAADSLTHLIIPPSVRTIEEEAFNYCDSLEVVLVPEDTDLDSEAFKNCGF